MKASLFVATLLAASLSCVAAEENWEPFFEGYTHDDFYFAFEEEDVDPEEVFIFKDDSGLLIKGADHPNGYIQTLDEYENYELKLEFRWPDEPGNSGIQLHSTSYTSFSIWPECIEVQLEHENVGDFWLMNHKIEVEEESQIPEKATERNRRTKLEDDLEKKPGEWNEMLITAKKDTIKVMLNGELVNKGTDASVSSGFITIQAEGADIEFRNVAIRLIEDDELEEDDQ
ncbi:DUF1080 domain-containing protein [Pelagicoccus sp. SDUM812003]|uniref:3-keto-disaccharide hydrolase n=1 Tax=Pelagicoccus sp. SDUM812003 TaxID=3041267 RepID=UPI00280F3789|nr:DUF1080 domain-containing protein [Pelagicoccus sp. SDUM812003]MDQ8201917.1 DUF1080 domain-containing protein [Pelagicoccus sp. SDUM812003]